MLSRALPSYAVLAIATGCAIPTLANPSEFLPTKADRLEFRYERNLGRGSYIRGELVVDVAEVEQATADNPIHAIAGEITRTAEGWFTTRKAAREAPRQAVQAAMDPANVEEVFEVKQLGERSTMTKVHWDRLRNLRLPITATRTENSAPFRSALRGSGLDNTTEVAMLWHKPLMTFFHLPPFGTFSLLGAQLDGDVATIEIAQGLGSGKPLRYSYQVSRGGRLVSFAIQYRDGTTLRALPSSAPHR